MIKKIGRFLTVEDDTLKNKKGDILGFFGYEKKWGKYVFQAEEMCFFDKECLDDISKHLGEMAKI